MKEKPMQSIFKKLPAGLKSGIKYLVTQIGHLLFELTAPVWVRFLKISARTGWGTDLCLEHGFLPMRVHFYSPIPDINDLNQRRVWDKKSEMVGIDFRAEEQVRFLQELGKKFSEECHWSDRPTSNPDGFYTENNSFSFGCAASLHSIIRYYQPGKIIEIGSGNSSKVISASLELNQATGNYCKYVIIDPYPTLITKQHLPCLTQVINERVELTDLHHFQDLRKNDILFIDSGHTVRTGGDVNFLFLEVLPRLAPGVIVHIHDINLPDEYPNVYFTNPSFRMFWTESYLLQAFLSFNQNFQILLAMHYLMSDKNEEFCQAFTHYDSTKHKAISGSFWIQRTPE
jgi:hypothetical protein